MPVEFSICRYGQDQPSRSFAERGEDETRRRPRAALPPPGRQICSGSITWLAGSLTLPPPGPGHPTAHSTSVEYGAAHQSAAVLKAHQVRHSLIHCRTSSQLWALALREPAGRAAPETEDVCSHSESQSAATTWGASRKPGWKSSKSSKEKFKKHSRNLVGGCDTAPHLLFSKILISFHRQTPAWPLDKSGNE